MPLTGIILGQQITQKMALKGQAGSQTVNFANALGNGIVTSILATNVYNGVTTGMGPGMGVGTGKISGLVGFVVGMNIYNMMIAKGFTGSQQLNTALAIGEAFAEHVSSLGIVNSTGGPVALGAPPIFGGKGAITGIIGSLVGQQILTFMSASGFTGSQTLNLTMAVGEGIAISMAATFVITTIVGVPAPPPAGPVPVGGAEVGKLV